MRVTKRIRFEDLEAELRAIPDKIEAALNEPLSLQRMETNAKAFCPVDTGTLQGSVRVERRGPHTSVLIAGGEMFINPKTGRPCDYAVMVHEGTSRTPARPFLLQAVLVEKYNLLKEILRGTMSRF